MVVHLSPTELNDIFRALAHATRRDIVRRTLVDEPTVSELAARYDMSFAAVQKHVAKLENAGLVTKTKDGRQRLVRAVPERLARAQQCLRELEQIWKHRLDVLDAIVSEPHDNTE